MGVSERCASDWRCSTMHTDPELLSLLALGEQVGTDDDRLHVQTCPICADEVSQLATMNRELQQRVRASESLDSVARQARQLGYIRPGEHLFIVKGIKAWQKAHSKIDGGGQ